MPCKFRKKKLRIATEILKTLVAAVLGYHTDFLNVKKLQRQTFNRCGGGGGALLPVVRG